MIHKDAEEEHKQREAYEKHRVYVEPKFAGIDESMTFEEPNVSCR